MPGAPRFSTSTSFGRLQIVWMNRSNKSQRISFFVHENCLISGAGIAGSTLAFWLKAAGFEPTLIERASALRTGGYVIDFWGLGYDIAERMGVIAEIHCT